MLACQNGHTEVVKSLIDAKAQLDLHQKASIDCIVRYVRVLKQREGSKTVFLKRDVGIS